MKATSTWRGLGAELVRAALTNPIGFFYVFRWITWLFAVFSIYGPSAPREYLRFEPGLLLYAAFQLAIGTLYANVIHPRLTRQADDSALGKAPYDLVALGIADMIGSLIILYWSFYSGRIGSPFWHYAVTSVLVPCFLLPSWRGLAAVVAFVAGYTMAVHAGLGGNGLSSALAPDQRQFFIGNMVTSFLVAFAVNYIGGLFRALQAERLRTRRALQETEALRRVTESIVQGGGDLGEMLTRLTQVVRTSRLFDQYAVFLRNDGGELRLVAATVGVEELGAALTDPSGLVGRAAREGRTLTTAASSNGPWQAAVPLLAGDHLVGVMVAGTGPNRDVADSALRLAESIGSQVAIGIQNATLARQKEELAAQEERSRISREIHDGIAQGIYMLSLNLETSAELALQRREDLPERLGRLVALSKQTLLEVRHYIFDLKPYLAGERGAASMVENQVREFAKVTGVPASFAAKGQERLLPVPVATCLYRVTQEALANAFKHARSAPVRVSLEFLAGNVRLTVEDDGPGFEPASTRLGHGLQNMRERSQELDGSFRLESAPGAGTRLVVTLPC